MKFFTAILIAVAIATQSVSAQVTEAPAVGGTNATDSTTATEAPTTDESTNSTMTGSTGETSGSMGGMETTDATSTSSSASGSGDSSPTVGDASGTNAAVSLQSFTLVASAIVATAATALF